MSYLVEVDPSKCVGCGACSMLAPEIFGFDIEKNLSFVREGSDLTDLELLLKCAASCPVSAIAVKDASGNLLSTE